MIAVCPKGMGDSVRRLYGQGETINGAGINAASRSTRPGRPRAAIALWPGRSGWARRTRSGPRWPDEYRSDIVGERAILLGAVHGLVEALYRHFRLDGADPETAYERSTESITGPIARTISDDGLAAVRAACWRAGPVRPRVRAAYRPARDLVAEIYDEVADGTELRSVILAEQRLATRPMTEIGGSPMWSDGTEVRARRRSDRPSIHSPRASSWRR